MNSTMNNISFYIPRISTDYTSEDIIHTFSLAFIGDVKRVDFTPITPKDGSIPDAFQSAFIHMNYLYDSQIASEIYYATYTNNRQYKLWPGTNIFWILLKNLNPIPETNLNIHQVVENARLLEEKVLQQEQVIQEQQKAMDEYRKAMDEYRQTTEEHQKALERQSNLMKTQSNLITTQCNLIESQSEQLSKHSEQIYRTQETIHQMLYSVYDEKTNLKEIYLRYNYLMFGQSCSTRWLYKQEDDVHSCGDKDSFLCIKPYDKNDINDDHDSMPSLITMSDVEKSDDSLKERMRFTSDFCDNL